MSLLILIWVCTSQYRHLLAKSSPIDSSVSGSRFRVSGSPLLSYLIRGTAEELPHPTDKGRTLWDATNDDGKLFGLMGHANVSVKEEVKAIRALGFAKADNIGVSPLGSGSDYTVFLQRNGVGSMTRSDLIVDDNMDFCCPRYPVPTVDSAPPFMIPSIITTPSLTLKDGRNYTAIQASFATYVLRMVDIYIIRTHIL